VKPANQLFDVLQRSGADDPFDQDADILQAEGRVQHVDHGAVGARHAPHQEPVRVLVWKARRNPERPKEAHTLGQMGQEVEVDGLEPQAVDLLEGLTKDEQVLFNDTEVGDANLS